MQNYDLSNFKLSESTEKYIQTMKGKPASLIMVLHKVQKELTFLPYEAVETLSQKMNIPVSRIFSMISYYDMFRTIPKGKVHISVCTGAACSVLGGQDILSEIFKLYNIKPTELSEGGAVSLDSVRCVGACGSAPITIINDKLNSKTASSKIGKLIEASMPAS